MKKRIIRVEEEAKESLIEQIKFYEKRQKGLGREFRVEFNKAKSKIADNPFQFQKVHGIDDESVRRALLNRFPFKIFYVIYDTVISIFRVSRHSQNTGGLDDND